MSSQQAARLSGDEGGDEQLRPVQRDALRT